MKCRRQVTDPRAVEAFAIEHAYEDLRIGVRHMPKRVRSDERVDVDHRRLLVAGCWLLAISCAVLESVAATQRGKLPFGKIRAAFRQRMALRSSALNPMTSRARSFASPVSIVRSQPQSRRDAPSASSA